MKPHSMQISLPMSLRLWLCGLLFLVVGCSSPDAKQSADSKKQSKQENLPWADWNEQLGEMTGTLNLSPEEQSKLTAAFDEQKRKVEDWWNEGGQRLQDMDARLIKALKDRDADSIKQLKEEVGPLREWLNASLADRKRAILDSLSEENRDEWISHLLVKKFLEIYHSIDFSEEQMASIKQLALSIAGQVREETNPEGLGLTKLEQSVEMQILDQAQRTTFEQLKKKNPLRGLGSVLGFDN